MLWRRLATIRMTLMSKHIRVKQLAIRVMPWPAMSKAAIVTVPAGSSLAVTMTGWLARCTAILRPLMFFFGGGDGGLGREHCQGWIRDMFAIYVLSLL